MKNRKIDLYSGSGAYKGSINIYPITVCGRVEHNSRYQIVEEHGCPISADHVAVGGRSMSVVEVPKGYDLMQLTAPETHYLKGQLGKDYEKFVVPDTVHGVWKVVPRQGAVLVKIGHEPKKTAQYPKRPEIKNRRR